MSVKRDTCVQVISYFYATSQNRFFMSHMSNPLVVEAVIMHETKGFSCALRDKRIVRENNRIVECVQLIFMLSCARIFFLVNFSHLACFSYLTDVSQIVCSRLNSKLQTVTFRPGFSIPR